MNLTSHQKKNSISNVELFVTGPAAYIAVILSMLGEALGFSDSDSASGQRVVHMQKSP